MHLRTTRVALVVLFGLLAACAPVATPAAVAPPASWPTRTWPTAQPEEHGFAATLPVAIEGAVQAGLPFLDALLVIRHGTLVHESYYNGYDATTLHDIASVSKSWTSALTGMAQAEGWLTSLDASLPELLPERFSGGTHADKAAITLRHLLTMRSGIDFSEDVLNSGGYGGQELLESDLTALALDFPMVRTPGESWNYSTLDAQLVSAIVERAVGQPLADYAREGLFATLGVGPTEWLSDGAGATIGGQNLSMAPRDMAKLGLLYLHGGVWEGEQVVPAEWVRLSLTPQGDAYYAHTGQNEVIEWYGLFWWLWKGDWFYGYRSFQAAGYGGQQVLVVPELDLILVTTARLEGVDPTTEQAQAAAVYELFHEVIFPTLTDVEIAR